MPDEAAVRKEVPAVGAVFLDADGASRGAPEGPPRRPAAAHRAEPLTAVQAVQRALAVSRSLLAARLAVDEATVARVAAGLWPNPEVGYDLTNIVVGPPNGQDIGLRPGHWSQLQHTVTLSQSIDPFLRRGLRVDAALRGEAVARLEVQDAVRNLVFAVRSAFAAVEREQWQLELTEATQRRHEETVALSRKRYQAGEISSAELRKIELEGLKYLNDSLEVQIRLGLTRTELAALLAYESDAALPELQDAPPPPLTALDHAALTATALAQRPDYLALQAAAGRAEAALQTAYRERYPEVGVGLSYTRSHFQISGDNPHALGVHLALPLPLFGRNQEGIGGALVARRRQDHLVAAQRLAVLQEVGAALHRHAGAYRLRASFEDQMLEASEQALAVAERSYRAGAVSLLEILEAQRTHLETRAEYLQALYGCHQALIDLNHAVGGVGP